MLALFKSLLWNICSFSVAYFSRLCCTGSSLLNAFCELVPWYIHHHLVVIMLSVAVRKITSTYLCDVFVFWTERIHDCCNDQQKRYLLFEMCISCITAYEVQRIYSFTPFARLAEARSLHDELLYEKAKLQINHVKLDKLQVGIISSSFQPFWWLMRFSNLLAYFLSFCFDAE